MCLIRAWNIGLATRWVTLRFSQHNVGVTHKRMQSSQKSDVSYRSLEVAFTRALYSTLVLEQATVDYFIELQETRVEPR